MRGRRAVSCGRCVRAGLIPADAGQTSILQQLPEQTRAHPRRRGLIPADAGQTAISWAMACCMRAHPRRCGADVASVVAYGVARGSSPQMRGRRQTASATPPGTGLIPADAGQTRRRRTPGLASRAHPRRCGADIFADDAGVILSGSSPQVRGRRWRWPRWAWLFRLIPAGAGQTNGVKNREGHFRAHPRRCGADSANSATSSASSGSSPQVRGRRCCR